MKKSAKYYHSAKGQAAYEKKKAYDSKFEAKPEHVKQRVEANAFNRKHGTKGDLRDASHTKDGRIVLEAQSKNRARQGAGGKAKKK